MIGIVDVGGGLRGIYGAGVFDRLMDQNIVFDYQIGVSAGSAIFRLILRASGEEITDFIPATP